MTDLSIIEDDDASYLSIDQILMEEQKLTCQSRYNFLDLDFRRAKEGNHSFFYQLACYLIFNNVILRFECW